MIAAALDDLADRVGTPQGGRRGRLDDRGDRGRFGAAPGLEGVLEQLLVVGETDPDGRSGSGRVGVLRIDKLNDIMGLLDRRLPARERRQTQLMESECGRRGFARRLPCS